MHTAHSRPHPIRSEADYERMVAMMTALLDETRDDEDHPLSGLLELIADGVSRYEQQHHAIATADPKDALHALRSS